MRHKGRFLLLIVCFAMLAAVPVRAQVSYLSQPDRLYIFLNDIAYVEDTVELPGSASVEIVLPGLVFVDTLVIAEDGQRVPTYRVRQDIDRSIISWESAGDDSVRTVTLSYLMRGMSWQPKYDMVIAPDETSVEFAFFAEIRNSALALDGVEVNLISGRVDTSQSLDAVSTVTTNQLIVGYEQPAPLVQLDGVATIQYVYAVGDLDAEPGDTIFKQIGVDDMSARKTLVWNASRDNSITVIYKVTNALDVPLAEGTVRSYQDGLFLGSDFIEVTPLKAEGSVTVGSLQNVRVFREATRQSTETLIRDTDTLNTITLEMTNLASDTVTFDVVDTYPASAVNFSFDREATFEPGNLLRWTVTLEPGERLELSYEYET